VRQIGDDLTNPRVYPFEGWIGALVVDEGGQRYAIESVEKQRQEHIAVLVRYEDRDQDMVPAFFVKLSRFKPVEADCE
jgi:hypothetical protein